MSGRAAWEIWSKKHSKLLPFGKSPALKTPFVKDPRSTIVSESILPVFAVTSRRGYFSPKSRTSATARNLGSCTRRRWRVYTSIWDTFVARAQACNWTSGTCQRWRRRTWVVSCWGCVRGTQCSWQSFARGRRSRRARRAPQGEGCRRSTGCGSQSRWSGRCESRLGWHIGCRGRCIRSRRHSIVGIGVLGLRSRYHWTVVSFFFNARALEWLTRDRDLLGLARYQPHNCETQTDLKEHQQACCACRSGIEREVGGALWRVCGKQQLKLLRGPKWPDTNEKSPSWGKWETRMRKKSDRSICISAKFEIRLWSSLSEQCVWSDRS